VTAPLFVVDPPAAAAAEVGGTVRLDGPEGRHAVSVARVGAGEQIDLGDGRGTVLRTRVESVQGRDALVARVLARDSHIAPHPRVIVVQAIPKGDRAETAVETMTEVGVDVIVPWQAQRCIARWTPERAERGRAKWAGAAQAAGKQSRRAWFPEVAAAARMGDVEGLVAGAALALVLHEEAATPLAGIRVPESGDVVLVVGPEGGLTADEIVRLQAAGAVAVRMGPTVLRSSTAGTAAAAIVMAGSGRWS
jgi:16S rRNA (uracil1498-N3)-methyltransferase